MTGRGLRSLVDWNWIQFDKFHYCLKVEAYVASWIEISTSNLDLHRS